MLRQQLRRLAGLDREVIVEPLPGDEEPFVVNRQIKAHFQQWHKGEPDPYANGDS